MGSVTPLSATKKSLSFENSGFFCFTAGPGPARNGRAEQKGRSGAAARLFACCRGLPGEGTGKKRAQHG